MDLTTELTLITLTLLLFYLPKNAIKGFLIGLPIGSLFSLGIASVLALT